MQLTAVEGCIQCTIYAQGINRDINQMHMFLSSLGVCHPPVLYHTLLCENRDGMVNPMVNTLGKHTGTRQHVGADENKMYIVVYEGNLCIYTPYMG